MILFSPLLPVPLILSMERDACRAVNATTVLFLPRFYVTIELSQSRDILELQKLDLLDNPKDDSWKEGQFINLR